MAMAPDQGTAGGGRMCCIACSVAEESRSGCQCNAMKVQIGSRHDRDYEYIKDTWGTKIAKILVFPPNQSDGKEMFRSQLRNDSFNNTLSCSKLPVSKQ